MTTRGDQPTAPPTADPPTDAAARQRIGGATADLTENLFVEAGAGTGKTTALVSRLVATAARAGADGLHRIAAITFTEAAAAELRARVAGELRASADPAVRALAARADEITIGTIHGFARSLLAEHPIAAGLPPGFDVLDEATATVELRAAWDRFLRQLLADPAARPALLRGRALGLRVRDLEAVGLCLHRHWDRLLHPTAIAQLATWPLATDAWPPVRLNPLIAALEPVVDRSGECTDPDDKLCAHLRQVVAPALAELRAAAGQPASTAPSAKPVEPGAPAGPEGDVSRLRALAGLPKLRTRAGRSQSWPQTPVGDLRAGCEEADELRAALLDQARATVLRDLTARVAGFVLQAAEERQRAGRLGFHDLLVLAHRLASTDPSALAAMRDRYRWLFIDELQDTDPLQTALAFLLAGEPPRPGGLFVVGDPKQSIYRFRQADIRQYGQIQARLDTRVELQCSFRSVPGIVDWVNAVFAELLEGSADRRSPGPSGPAAPQPRADGTGRDPVAGQAPHRDLVATRRSEPGTPVPVVIVGAATNDPAPVRRADAAADVALVLQAAHGEGGHEPWMVHDRNREEEADAGRRAARWSDMAILFPTRQALADLELALEQAGIPYRLEGAGLLWQSQEVRDLLAVLRAADRPADTLAVLAALRSPLFGCGDDDLLAHARAHPGLWDPVEATPVLRRATTHGSGPDDGEGHHGDAARGPGGRAGGSAGGNAGQVQRDLAALARYYRLRWTEEPSALLGRIVRERRALELCLAHRRPRDRWQRIRWLVEQARQFDEQHGGAVADLLAWADAQAAEDGRTAAGTAPDPDDDAVRVMTVHGAKGLEFPVVVLTGLDARPSPAKEPALWNKDGTLEVSVGSASEGRLFCTDGYAACREEEQRLDELERRRLLYVATTRARDHLVLALHRKDGEQSLAALVAGALAGQDHLWRVFDAPDGAAGAHEGEEAGEPRATTTATTGGPPEFAPSWAEEQAAWDAERAGALARARRPVVTAMLLVAATAGEANPPAPDPADPALRDNVAWDADTGLRRGRAVHDALRELDLASGVSRASGAPAAEVALRYARVHRLHHPEEQAEVVRLVASALAGPLAELVRGRRTFQEMPVAVPLPRSGMRAVPPPGQPVLEGTVDLVVELPDGYAVVDYKTSAETAVTGAIARYRPQLAAYACAIEAATDRPVVGASLYLLGPEEARLEPLTDLRDAIGELPALAARALALPR